MTNDEIVKRAILKVLELGATAEFVGPVTTGPRLLYFGLRPTGSTKVNKLEDMSMDIATALKVEAVMMKRMPGMGVVGVYIPRPDPELLQWRDLLGKAATYPNFSGLKIPLLLGVDWQGNVFLDDLTLCPHLLIAGSTGGGKSVLLRSLIATLVQTVNSDAVRLVLSDTKTVEFTDLMEAPNLLWPRATSYMQTLTYMQDLKKMTDERLELFGTLGLRNIQEFNETRPTPMPYIVLVIDELADIVNSGKKDPGSNLLDYLTRKSRAAGIHVLAATQRPSVDVVAGVIKNNFPCRLSFKMASAVDSRVVLDTEGAEHLLARGDMLYRGTAPGLQRLHSGIASTNDIKAILAYVNFQQFQNEQRRLTQ